MDFLYRFRNFISGPPAIILALLVVTTPITKVIERLAQKDDETVVNLDEPPPPPPPPPKIERELPPEPKEVQPVAPVPDVITKESVVTEIKPPAPEPVKEAVKSEVPPGPPVPAGPTVAQIEAGYAGIIFRYLESIKRYPTSREARTQRPTGKVYLWVEVGRDGSMKEAGIIKSSFSQVLDNAAMATARNGQYPPFPATAFPGESSHRFNVTLEYQLEAQN